MLGSQKTNLPDLNREIRYRLSDAPVVKVTSQSHDHRATERLHDACLIDVSQHGARLTSSSRIPVDDAIRLDLIVEDLGMEFHVAGKVCWNEQADDGSYLTGCVLEPWLPDGVLDRLAKGGRLDRRFDPRFSEDIKLAARRESIDGHVPVTLRNYSNGGFCFLSSESLTLDERLLFCVDQTKNVLIVATLIWQLRVEEQPSRYHETVLNLYP